MKVPILVDQGKDDGFLSQNQLLPDNFAAVCSKKGIPLNIRMQDVCKKAKVSYSPIRTNVSFHFDN